HTSFSRDWSSDVCSSDLALWGMTDLHQMNGLKNGLSFILSTISVAIFAVGGLVLWYQAILMMIAALIGGYAGAPIARALPRPVRSEERCVGKACACRCAW